MRMCSFSKTNAQQQRHLSTAQPALKKRFLKLWVVLGSGEDWIYVAPYWVLRSPPGGIALTFFKILCWSPCAFWQAKIELSVSLVSRYLQYTDCKMALSWQGCLPNTFASISCKSHRYKSGVKLPKPGGLATNFNPRQTPTQPILHTKPHNTLRLMHIYKTWYAFIINAYAQKYIKVHIRLCQSAHCHFFYRKTTKKLTAIIRQSFSNDNYFTSKQ